jgi:hypothetical protein
MATAQVASDQRKAGMLGERDAGGFVYTAIGGINFYTGEGVPSHAAVKGSVYVNVSTGKMHTCVTADTAATGSWEILTGS